MPEDVSPEPEEVPTLTGFLLYLAGLKVGQTLEMIPEGTQEDPRGVVKMLHFTSGFADEQPDDYTVTWVDMEPKAVKLRETPKTIMVEVENLVIAQGPVTIPDIAKLLPKLSNSQIRMALAVSKRLKMLRGMRWIWVEAEEV